MSEPTDVTRTHKHTHTHINTPLEQLNINTSTLIDTKKISSARGLHIL